LFIGYLLMDKPEVYGLPNAANAKLPSRNNLGGYLGTLVAAAAALVGGLVAFRRRREGAPGDAPAESRSDRTPPAAEK
jgi:formate dehydrogenase iron-sulfur subunit